MPRYGLKWNFSVNTLPKLCKLNTSDLFIVVIHLTRVGVNHCQKFYGAYSGLSWFLDGRRPRDQITRWAGCWHLITTRPRTCRRERIHCTRKEAGVCLFLLLCIKKKPTLASCCHGSVSRRWSRGWRGHGVKMLTLKVGEGEPTLLPHHRFPVFLQIIEPPPPPPTPLHSATQHDFTPNESERWRLSLRLQTGFHHVSFSRFSYSHPNH